MSWQTDVSAWTDKPNSIQVFSDDGREQDYVPERTCRVEGSRSHDYGYAPVGTVWEWDLSCGDTVEGDDPPDYCPRCGAKVVSE